jgi:hypothetical protein
MTMTRSLLLAALAATLSAGSTWALPSAAPAEPGASSTAAEPGPAAADAAAAPDDDLELDANQPDFSVINMPTTLRLPTHHGAFRVTHRFARGFSQGDFGDLASDFFGFDGGAQIGLEFRFGLAPGAQLGFYRTSDRTIEFFGQYQLVRQGGSPLGIDLAASVEGLDNFQEDFAPRVALVLSRNLGTRSALYLEPAFIGNTRLGPDAPGDDATLLVRVGGRFGLGAGVALLAEAAPRLAGYKGGPNGATHLTFGLEKGVGGHSFQLNVSNDLGTTPAQVARGRTGRDDWFLGFNISRKFY